ncbi:MAG: hypothetical protein KDH96_12120, partial [Candidatus Riesia sp.]|nr:hypothetical protein [Candidatus Riesia sp.]
STDDFLHDCIEDALDEINFFYRPTSYTFDSIISKSVPWNLVKLGATLQMLTGKGILSARNVLSYNDVGGIQVSDYDVYGRYINYYNVLINKYQEFLRAFKLSSNINDCYGGFGSEMDQEAPWQW